MKLHEVIETRSRTDLLKWATTELSKVNEATTPTPGHLRRKQEHEDRIKKIMQTDTELAKELAELSDQMEATPSSNTENIQSLNDKIWKLEDKIKLNLAHLHLSDEIRYSGNLLAITHRARGIEDN